eukprot:9032288-Pyramimonas_sp.AAC.1
MGGDIRSKLFRYFSGCSELCLGCRRYVRWEQYNPQVPVSLWQLFRRPLRDRRSLRRPERSSAFSEGLPPRPDPMTGTVVACRVLAVRAPETGFHGPELRRNWPL